MSKILFVDCDGTIREPKSGAKFIQHPQDQQIIKEADQAIANYARMKYTIIGVSNQGGVAAGHKNLADCIAEQEYTLNLFPLIETILFCPDYEGMVCYRVWRKFAGFDLDACNREEFDYPSFRKPGAGMLILGMELCSAERHDCLMVGDRPEDEAAAGAAGVQFLWAMNWIDQAGWSE